MSGDRAWDAVLFDLDGTLADTVGLILRCYRHTMQVHRGHVLPDELWIAGMGTRLKEQLARFAGDAAEVEAMAETYATHQQAIHDDLVAPFPGAVELLTTLRSRGSRLGIVTSRRRGMAERTLERIGLGGLYDVLVGGDDVALAKPHPEPVLLALSHLGLVDAGPRTLMVGDAPFDVRAGRGAGTRTAGALWGPFDRTALEAEAPDWLVSELAEVLALRP